MIMRPWAERMIRPSSKPMVRQRQASALDIADQRVIAKHFTQILLQIGAARLKRSPLTKPAQLFVEFCKAQLGTGNGAEVG
jgi:hypothetical protein